MHSTQCMLTYILYFKKSEYIVNLSSSLLDCLRLERASASGRLPTCFTQVLCRQLSNMMSASCSLTEIQRRIDEVRRFLSVTISIANAHTVEFYTHDVWKRFMAVSPEEVLSTVSSCSDQQRAPQHKERGKHTRDKRES